MNVKVMLKKRDEGGFKATVPTLPDCTSIATNEDEALKNIRAKILLCLGIEEVV